METRYPRDAVIAPPDTIIHGYFEGGLQMIEKHLFSKMQQDPFLSRFICRGQGRTMPEQE